jgi:excisionase family DNA binding protein
MDALAAAVAMKLEPRVAAARPIQPRLLSVRQASKYLGCSEPSIYHQIKDGKLIVVRRDRRVFLDVKDLDRMIEECKQRIA